jgi:hypothetical protein
MICKMDSNDLQVIGYFGLLGRDLINEIFSKIGQYNVIKLILTISKNFGNVMFNTLNWKLMNEIYFCSVRRYKLSEHSELLHYVANRYRNNPKSDMYYEADRFYCLVKDQLELYDEGIIYGPDKNQYEEALPTRFNVFPREGICDSLEQLAQKFPLFIGMVYIDELSEYKLGKLGTYYGSCNLNFSECQYLEEVIDKDTGLRPLSLLSFYCAPTAHILQNKKARKPYYWFYLGTVYQTRPKNQMLIGPF